MKKEALVVKRDVLFNNKYFQGFLPIKEHDYVSIILKNFEYHSRGDELENNSDLQQIVPYVWIINPQTKKIFTYKRASDRNYSEARLRNKWSCGIGGHIERHTEKNSSNPIVEAMMRELREEVLMSFYPIPKIIGYLNDDKTDVGKVHFGVVAIVETSEDAKKGDDEMIEYKFVSINELEKMFVNPETDIEDWTRLSLPFIKKYIGAL